jgi:hypothetical protein
MCLWWGHGGSRKRGNVLEVTDCIPSVCTSNLLGLEAMESPESLISLLLWMPSSTQLSDDLGYSDGIVGANGSGSPGWAAGAVSAKAPGWGNGSSDGPFSAEDTVLTNGTVSANGPGLATGAVSANAPGWRNGSSDGPVPANGTASNSDPGWANASSNGPDSSDDPFSSDGSVLTNDTASNNAPG